MAKYKVKGTDILYNGKLFAEGKTINLEEDEASELADYLEAIPEKGNKKQDEGKQGKPAKEPENPEGGNK
ncbi:MAG: hypothetical protein PHC34_02780 [Candidatus Gastranaerophilales bacterium]|nr:hypothetical protein [Candidatus Gastranaerophilales bacterium]